MKLSEMNIYIYIYLFMHIYVFIYLCLNTLFSIASESIIISCI